MIRGQSLQVIWNARDPGDRAAIYNRLNLTKQSVKPLLINWLLLHNGVEHFPYCSYLPLLYSSEMGCGRWVEHLYSAMLLNLCIRSFQCCWNVSARPDLSLRWMHESVQRTCYLDVYSSHCQTGKSTPYLFDHGPTSFDLKSTEIVYANACKWWLIRYKPDTGKVCHNLTFCFPMLTSAGYTLWQGMSDGCMGSCNAILLPYLWPSSSWADLRMREVICMSLAKIAGCLEFSVMTDLFYLPPTLSMPSCMIGDSR